MTTYAIILADGSTSTKSLTVTDWTNPKLLEDLDVIEKHLGHRIVAFVPFVTDDDAAH